MVYKNALIFGA